MNKLESDIFFTRLSGIGILIMCIAFGISVLYTPFKIKPYMPLIEQGVSISNDIYYLNERIVILEEIIDIHIHE